ncbi:hydroxyacylglutathione hydrolase [Ramlibacter rhizophilus]|uniref:Hydroxyacylglutathione hydrolase n=1 Tax=Ramlibacter rhizophilus TaxID=1781167 RepID=A0A4Z0BJE1_9BURK|nr:hydroxyacylglutathione hydrolase [Ramlibacter rhizophilus]TFY98539.1 hydroxyacylglutathione hydrolase [Ramlibacter rhizophilus]
MKLIPLPAFQDNYLWLLQDGQRALVVDPGEAAPVFTGLRQAAAQLEAILVTHHHADHTGGVAALREATGAPVFGPAAEAIPQPATALAHGDACTALGLSFQVIAVPGHTAGHIAYYTPDVDGQPLLFCGDTLFSGGCGRLFEGTPAQMLQSLDTLAALPGTTRVCCAHEYTLSNLRFARAVEPDNEDLARYQQHCEALRAAGQPTLPSTLAQERAINPFLRTREPAVIRAAHAYNGAHENDEVAVFAAIRQWKNEFR